MGKEASMTNIMRMSTRTFARIQDFLRLESASGLLLMGAAAAAILLANSPLSGIYAGLLDVPFEIRLGEIELAKPLLLWINDGLMAIFFLLIGLEVKREVLDGHLSDRAQLVLPGLAAVGGMALPALIYVGINQNDPVALNGWAIPAATDIAFALGIVSLLGRRVPQSLKIFLLTLAILDDLAAIGIIALFYSGSLSLPALGLAAVTLLALFALNRMGVDRTGPYFLLGALLWVFVLKSGVHATLAGVAVALAIPMRSRQNETYSPVRHVEHLLHPWVAFIILPIFAFANAGLDLRAMTLATLFSPLPLGIMAGLFLGKPLGIFGLSWLAVKLRLARLPQEAGWAQLYGIAQMCGVGFTMSLFIASLAFENDPATPLLADRLGIIAGSLLSALWAYIVLRLAKPGSQEPSA
jgi:NhaA family Na+:H+ antiporter